MKLFTLEIVTPEGVTYEAKIKQVTLPGSEGEFGVLADHATLVSLLKAGIITIETENSENIDVAINAGYVKVDENKVSCIVDGAISLTVGDNDIAKKLEESRALLKGAGADDAAIATAMGRVDRIHQ
ncbi:MAG: F0F1 ATP synthase subunit epsilon [Sulfurovum sp.]|nr:F0F1 ATP synthase subunit epsilon [Sulfurovaceae bacterium]